MHNRPTRRPSDGRGRVYAAWARRLGQQADHRLGDAAGLLGALDFDRPLVDDLVPAAADLVDGDCLDAAPDPAAGRDRRREADLVPAVVHAELEAGRLEQLRPEAVDHRQRAVAVRDRRAEGAVGLGTLDIDVDPLVVAGELGELVDVRLGDLAPLARADHLPDEPADLIYAVDRDRHGCA